MWSINFNNSTGMYDVTCFGTLIQSFLSYADAERFLEGFPR